MLSVLMQCNSRLRNIVRYRDVTSNRFAVTMVPRTAGWGRAPRTEKILCIGGKPALIWLVGRVRSLWFFDRNGDPHLRVNLGFTLHSAEERAATSDLSGRSRPRAGTFRLSITFPCANHEPRIHADHILRGQDLQPAREGRILRHGTYLDLAHCDIDLMATAL